MPTFETPQPISVSFEVGVGDIRIAASDRPDTTVEVRPSDPSKRADVIAAEQTKVDYAGGRLVVKAPRGWRQFRPWGGHDSIDVLIELPVDSHVEGQAGVAGLSCSGRLGECRYKTGVGDVHVEQAGPVHVRIGAGDVAVDRAFAKTDIATGSGTVRLGTVDGRAVVKNSNGGTWVGGVTGSLRVHAANGRIEVDQSHASVTAKTANGDIRIGGVRGGAVVAETAFGEIEIGIRDGIAAWLDLNTKFGNVQNDLDAADRPGARDEAVEVRAHTSYGDITVGRSKDSIASKEDS
jgi:Putative adhesin